jgi:prephenate dehydratase
MRISFLGPRGSFAEAALRSMPVAAAAEHVPAGSVYEAMDLARLGTVDAALVPMENSLEGSVPLTLDELSKGDQLVIVDEVVLPVRFSLMARPGTTLAEVTRIATHPHAHAQVREWLRANLPQASVLPALSTSAAAAGLLDQACPYDAAVAQGLAAEIYGLQELATDIGDQADAHTRFVLVRQSGQVPAPTGADKTTLALYIHQDAPGALLAILNEFAVRGVNLTRIESRPTRKVLGDYFFSVDVEGHVQDARVAEALMGLHRICLDVRFLGSYPRHDGKAAVLRAGVTDADFAEAREWLANLKGR